MERTVHLPFYLLLYFFCFSVQLNAGTNHESYVFKAGHESLQVWRMGEVPYPEDNAPNEARIELGKKLFFDARLSSDGSVSCATCHNPLFGWSDGLATAKGITGEFLGRTSPVVTNTAYNPIQMWDGREKTLESQALGPMKSDVEMNTNIPEALVWLREHPEYSKMFEKAYPGEGINEITLGKAIASFERTVVSKDSPFDRWVAGDKKALNKQQVRGFKVFVDPDKGNCEVCHSAPNFTDNGFHNLGLASFDQEEPDLGRYHQKPIRLMKGAFKTPTLRDIEYSAPYFHDGSSDTLEHVVEHYITGGKVKTNVSPNMKSLSLTEKEKEDLIAFMKALSSPRKPFELPVLPL